MACLLVGLVAVFSEGCGDSGTQNDDGPVSFCSETPGSICTWAGTGDAGWDGDGQPLLESKFYWPVDLTITPSGQFYILDWNNHRVRHVTSELTLETVIGTDFVGDGPPDFSDQVSPGAPGTTVNLNHPTHLIPLPDGTLLLTAWHNHFGPTVDYAFKSTPSFVDDAVGIDLADAIVVGIRMGSPTSSTGTTIVCAYSITVSCAR